MAKKRVPDWLNSPIWSSPSEHNRFSAAFDPPEPPSPPPVTVEEDPPLIQHRTNHNGISTSSPSSSSSSASTSSADDMSISRRAQCQAQLLAELSRKVIDMRELRRNSSQGIPDFPGLRSTVWKLLLGYLPPDHALWSSELAKKRSQYKRFKQDILINPSEITRRMWDSADYDADEVKCETRCMLSRSQITHGEHPLSLGKTSIWNKFFQDGYRDMMKLADNFATFNQRLKYAHFRPLVPVKADSRSWWKYAYRAIEKRRKVTYGKWEEYERSLASYIKKHACSNAKTEDLWATLEEGSGEPVNKLMTTWTKQQGYPVVSVKVNNQNLEFDQVPLHPTFSLVSFTILVKWCSREGQWIVPITLCFGSYDVHKNFLFQTKSETRDVKELLGSPITEDSKSWIKINVEQAGFYRVKYDELLAAKLRYAIEKKILSPSDRFGILDDTYALCNARKESLTSLLNLMAAYREEDDYTVLSNLISISSKVQNIAADAVPDLLDYFKQFSINVLQYSAERLGWDPKPGETHDDALLRGEILTSLAEFGHDLTLDEASRRFQAFLENRNTPLLPPDIRRVRCSIIRNFEHMESSYVFFF
ncbi:hypothetical protein KIW84_064020 [Lathyrus oleraceus]|uniref:ERAP1-like C-terminal domain-containing protein n=2 Tax=Pisum sativum TaxID=3888 RepID=A0A9D5A8J0_PEA|nr:hypothetical protein KIW84_064020 [Pisum sativum]